MDQLFTCKRSSSVHVRNGISSSRSSVPWIVSRSTLSASPIPSKKQLPLQAEAVGYPICFQSLLPLSDFDMHVPVFQENVRFDPRPHKKCGVAIILSTPAFRLSRSISMDVSIFLLPSSIPGRTWEWKSITSIFYCNLSFF